LEAKFGFARAGDGDIPSISRQGQRSEAGRPCPPWRCTLTAGGTLRAPSVQGDFRIHPIKLL